MLFVNDISCRLPQSPKALLQKLYEGTEESVLFLEPFLSGIESKLERTVFNDPNQSFKGQVFLKEGTFELARKRFFLFFIVPSYRWKGKVLEREDGGSEIKSTIRPSFATLALLIGLVSFLSYWIWNILVGHTALSDNLFYFIGGILGYIIYMRIEFWLMMTEVKKVIGEI